MGDAFAFAGNEEKSRRKGECYGEKYSIIKKEQRPEAINMMLKNCIQIMVD
jgi:hypothetical protein